MLNVSKSANLSLPLHVLWQMQLKRGDYRGYRLNVHTIVYIIIYTVHCSMIQTTYVQYTIYCIGGGGRADGEDWRMEGKICICSHSTCI